MGHHARTLLSAHSCSQETPNRLDVGDDSSMSDMSLYALLLDDAMPIQQRVVTSTWCTGASGYENAIFIATLVARRPLLGMPSVADDGMCVSAESSKCGTYSDELPEYFPDIKKSHQQHGCFRNFTPLAGACCFSMTHFGT